MPRPLITASHSSSSPSSTGPSRSTPSSLADSFSHVDSSLTRRLAATAPLPPNLLLWPDDARALLRLLPEACLDAAFLLFPDPWPKARHAKRRFVHPEIVPIMARAMKPGAPWRVASDDPTYQAWVAEVMDAQSLFSVAEPARTRPPGWPPTRYEAKARREGREVWYFRYRRV